jgi:predicted transcriptional regulator
MTSPDQLDAVLRLTPQLGPAAVVVLLDLARHEEAATVASIGGRLGMGRDRVAHALARLRHVGLVSVTQARREGRFANTRYTAHLPTTSSVGSKRRTAADGTLPLFPDAATP